MGESVRRAPSYPWTPTDLMIRALLAPLVLSLGLSSCPSLGSSSPEPVRSLRTAQVVAEELGAVYAEVDPHLSVSMLRVAAAVESAADALELISEGAGEPLDAAKALEVALAVASSMLDQIDDEDKRTRVAAVVASIRIAAALVASEYATEGE